MPRPKTAQSGDYAYDKSIRYCACDSPGKRRMHHEAGTNPVYWRWYLGYSTLAEYEDTTPDWSLGDMTRFFVSFGHTALAEADLDPSGNPANAVYRYLAHDHLGTGRYAFN